MIPGAWQEEYEILHEWCNPDEEGLREAEDTGTTLCTPDVEPRSERLIERFIETLGEFDPERIRFSMQDWDAGIGFQLQNCDLVEASDYPAYRDHGRARTLMVYVWNERGTMMWPQLPMSQDRMMERMVHLHDDTDLTPYVNWLRGTYELTKEDLTSDREAD